MSDLTPNVLGQVWTNDIISKHDADEYNNPAARFFYVSFALIKKDGGFGFTSCTSITTYGSLPNLPQLEKETSENGLYGVTVLNILEMTRDEFTKFIANYDSPVTHTYPATFTQQKDGVFIITFRDVPGAITQAYSFADAVDMAEDALITMFIGETDIPLPSEYVHGDVLITVTI